MSLVSKLKRAEGSRWGNTISGERKRIRLRRTGPQNGFLDEMREQKKFGLQKLFSELIQGFVLVQLKRCKHF
jgi:hypothetical protein